MSPIHDETEKDPESIKIEVKIQSSQPRNENTEIKEEETVKETWWELLYDYSKNTTLHGVKYLTSENKCSLRQIIWLLIMTTAVVLFTYLFVQRFIHFYGHPRAVNVEMKHEPQLPFPAVTICNQNQFRLTKVQGHGLYDLLTQGQLRLDKSDSSSYREREKEECKDSYVQEYPNTCIRPHYRQNHSVTYKEVTLNGCKNLCTEYHGMKCFTILFMSMSRSCILLPRIDVKTISGGKDCIFAQIFQRQRCLETRTSRIYCDFEETDCALLQDSTNTDEWQRVQASYTNSGYGTDHTTSSGKGHMNYLTKRSRSVDSSARLMTKFFKSDDYCLQVFVRPSGPSTFRIYVKGEDHINHLYAQEVSKLYPLIGWDMIFVNLPKGVNQVIMEGLAPKDAISGILMDDLTIAPCAEFAEATCRKTKDGEDYLGSLSVSENQKACQPWTKEQKTQMNKYIQQITSKECRLLRDDGFVCHVGNGTLENCAVKPCDCRRGTRACENGVCVPSELFCNGVRDCHDGSDELQACDDQHAVTCDFKSGFRCGYGQSAYRQNTSEWKRMDPVFVDLFNNGDHYMIFASANATSAVQVHIRSPSITLRQDSCLTFHYIVNYTDSAVKGSLAVYMHEEMIGRRLWLSRKTGKQVAQVSIPANHSNFSFGFLATIMDPSSTTIAFTNVQLLDKSCRVNPATVCDFRCDDGSCVTRTALCDGVSDCEDETDEQYETCSDFTISPSCDFDDKYMCGYKIQSPYGQITWAAQKEFYFREPSSCGQNFTAPSGYVTSPNFPYQYRQDIACRSMIITPPGTRIKLQFEVFEIAGARRNCRRDWLQIFDSDSVTPLTKKLCGFSGSRLPKPVLSTNNRMVLYLNRGDAYLYDGGFSATYAVFGSAINNYLPKVGGMVAVEYRKEVLSTYVNTYLTSPRVISNSASCLTFRYFHRGPFALWLLSGMYNMSLLLSIQQDGGKAWHSVSLGIPAGSYRLQWELRGSRWMNLPAVYNQLSSKIQFDDPVEDGPLVAIDDVVLHNVTCKELVGSHTYMTCDFGQENLCGYDIDLTRWTRIKRRTAYYLATQTNYRPGGYPITSPYAVVTTRSCIAITAVVLLPKNMPDKCVDGLHGLLTRYDVYFYNRNDDLKLMATLYGQHALASFTVFSFSDADLRENGEDLRMEIKVLTTSSFFLDRVEVFSDCTGLANATGEVGDSGTMAGFYDDTPTPYTPTTFPNILLPTFSYQTGVIFSDESTHLHHHGPSSYDIGRECNATKKKNKNKNRNKKKVQKKKNLSSKLEIMVNQSSSTEGFLQGIPVDLATLNLLNFSVDYSTVEPMSHTGAVLSYTEAPTASTVEPLEIGQAIGFNETYIDETEVINDIGEFYTYSGHQLHEQIFRCRWDNEPCQKFFKSHVTDLGYCHTFNADPETKVNVRKTGSGFGLRLIVNIEQYEYIEGSNTDAGIKVQLHDQDDVPMIKDLAFAVSPGVHALVATSYTTVHGLKEPYGTCDEAPLSLYGQGATYTHARCRHQCNSNYTMLNCSCKDAFMPGNYPVCNITEYLKCILPIKEQFGFAHANCQCPVACKVTKFKAELSYSSLSSLSVSALLGNDMEDIVKSYHSALEISHRVRVHRLRETVEMLSNVSTKLGRFVWIMESVGQYTVQRANEALLSLERLIRNDFWMLSRRFKLFKESYETIQGKNVSIAVRCLERILSQMHEFEVQDNLNRFDFTITVEDLKNYDASSSSNQNSMLGKVSTSPVTTYLQQLLPWLKNHTFSMRHIPFDIREYVPHYIWKRNECTEVLNTIIEAFPIDIHQYYENELAAIILNNFTLIKGCLLEYETNSQKVVEAIGEAEESVSKLSRNKKFKVYDSDEIQLLMEDQLTHIKQKMAYFDGLARKYAENKITKLQIAKEVNRDVLTKVDNNIEKLLYYLEVYATGPLKFETAELIAHTTGWYHNILNQLHELSQHFINTKGIDNMARGMQIWRVPIVRFETTQVLDFKHEYKWVTWPKGSTIRDLPENKQYLDVIASGIYGYITSVNELLYELDGGLFNGRQQVLNSMTMAADSLEKFKQTAQISPEFIINNFLMMDVYFPELKYEAMEQIEAYGVQNLLSETGGYLGLLIGGSVLTLCEIFDLIIYNLVLQCRAKL